MNIIYLTRNNERLPKYGMLSYEFSVLLGRSRRHRPLVRRQKLAPLKSFFTLMVMHIKYLILGSSDLRLIFLKGWSPFAFNVEINLHS